jgi:general secretion pathway protein A
VLETERRSGTRCVYLSNPTLTRAEFVEFLASAFDLSARAATSKTVMLHELERVLLDRQSKGVLTALLVDEAQAMPIELLEEVRLLANIETATAKLLPIVLAGQPQLAERLNDPDLKQLKQRVALRCDLQPLTLPETIAYIARRVRIAGGESSQLFTREALELIHECSKGIPRTIGVVCDNSLVSGFASSQRPVGWEIVHEVCVDFDLDPPERAAVVVAPSRPAAVGAAVAAEASPAPVRASAPAKSLVTRIGETASGPAMFSSFSRPRRFSFF